MGMSYQPYIHDIDPDPEPEEKVKELRDNEFEVVLPFDCFEAACMAVNVEEDMFEIYGLKYRGYIKIVRRLVGERTLLVLSITTPITTPVESSNVPR